MPRTARASVAHTWYHALNRGNRREEVVHKAADYHAFVQDIAGAHARLPVDILGYCLMPNHCRPLSCRRRRPASRSPSCCQLTCRLVAVGPSLRRAAIPGCAN